MAVGGPWRFRWALIGLLLLPASARAQSSALELAVKATYLYKLAPFVSWPAGVLNGPEEPLVICIQGQDPFGAVLDRAVAGQRVGGHPIAVRRLTKVDRTAACHILYLAGSPAQSAGQGLDAVQGTPVLTVTDAARGASRGMIHLVLDGGRVRFAVDAGRAETSGLAISSKLLALATQVTRR